MYVQGPLPPSRSGVCLTPLEGHRGQGLLSISSESSKPGTSSATLRATTAVNQVTTNLSESDNIKVAVRIRPLNQTEQSKGSTNILHVPSNVTLKVVVPGPAGSTMQRDFAFHACLGPEVTQHDVLNLCGIPQLLDAAMQGYNVTIFAYGQTGSGKTYTMSGREDVISTDNYQGDTHDGIITRAMLYLFGQIASASDAKYSASASYLEIYNEGIYDLLNLKAKNLPVKWDANLGFHVPGLKQVTCTSKDGILDVIRTGMKQRHVGSHELNIESSRSHSIMTVHLQATSTDPNAVDFGTPRLGKISFVDLAGSERLKDSKSEGIMLKETTNINKSLFVLGKVISALADRDTQGTSAHIPYRDSKLTKLLMDSLGGSALALMIACCSPSSLHVEETLSTLTYATRAKNIQNRPTVQYDPKEAQLAQLRREVELLRHENMYLRDQLKAGGAPAAGLLGINPQLPGALPPTSSSGGAPPGSSHGLHTQQQMQQQQQPLQQQQVVDVGVIEPQPRPTAGPGWPQLSGGPPSSSGGPPYTAGAPGVPRLASALADLSGMSPASSFSLPPTASVRSSFSSPQAHLHGALEPIHLGVPQPQEAPQHAVGGSGAAAPAGPSSSVEQLEHTLEFVNRLLNNGGVSSLPGGSGGDLTRRLKETQSLLNRFAEENGRLAKENDRLRGARQVLSAEHADVLDEIDNLRNKLVSLETAVRSGNSSPALVRAALRTTTANAGQGPSQQAPGGGEDGYNSGNSPMALTSRGDPSGGPGSQFMTHYSASRFGLATGSNSTMGSPLLTHHPPPSPGEYGQGGGMLSAEDYEAQYSSGGPSRPHSHLSQVSFGAAPHSAASQQSPPGSSNGGPPWGTPPHQQAHSPGAHAAAGGNGAIANVLSVGSGEGVGGAMRTRVGTRGGLYGAPPGGQKGKPPGSSGEDSIIIADQSKLSLLLADISSPPEPAVPVRPVPHKPQEGRYANPQKEHYERQVQRRMQAPVARSAQGSSS